MAWFLNRVPKFDWYVVSRGSKSKHRNDTCLKEIGLRLQILKITLHSIMNTSRRIYVCSQETNKHALLITTIKSREIRFSIQISNTFHHRFASATQTLLCKYDMYKLENMKNKPKHTHIPYA